MEVYRRGKRRSCLTMTARFYSVQSCNTAPRPKNCNTRQVLPPNCCSLRYSFGVYIDYRQFATMATAYTPLASNPPGGTEEWPAGTPVAGFRNLFRLSLVSLLLGIPSLACQIYLVLTISATGEDGWVDSPANSVWASVVVSSTPAVIQSEC